MRILSTKAGAKVKYIFIVDTEQYSGNFEQPMAAAMTGIVGEYFSTTSQEWADKCNAEMGLSSDENISFWGILSTAGEHNDHDPNSYVSIWPTPGWFNNGMGEEFKDGDEEKAQQHVTQAFLQDARLVVYTGDPDAQKEHAEECITRSQEPFDKWPAYLSVAIFLYEQPSPEMMQDMFRRAKAYAQENNITVTGYRLIKEETVQTEVIRHD